MNINRNNYESFFLLYTDNELSVAERKAVELFVKDNADLQQELDMLQQTVVQPDKIIFSAKNSLLKPTAVSAETEEKLLLYIDGELSTRMAKEMKTMVSADDEIAAALSLLQQTKLSADATIVFPDKNLLYRKEDNKVIPFGWWKLAAAAIFIGFGVWGMKWYANKPGDTAQQIASSTTIQPAKPAKEDSVNKDISQQAIAATQVAAPTENITPKKVEPATQIKARRMVVPEEKILVKTEKEIKPSNNLPTPYFEKINNSKSNPNDVASVTLQTQKSSPSANNNEGADATNKQSSADNNVYPAAFSETNNDKQDQFAFSDDEPKKSRIGGLFRKAKRLLERNTKMKPGENNVKVANLEFAIQ
jgi:anti-sigma factor RsiW